MADTPTEGYSFRESCSVFNSNQVCGDGPRRSTTPIRHGGTCGIEGGLAAEVASTMIIAAQQFQEGLAELGGGQVVEDRVDRRVGEQQHPCCVQDAVGERTQYKTTVTIALLLHLILILLRG